MLHGKIIIYNADLFSLVGSSLRHERVRLRRRESLDTMSSTLASMPSVPPSSSAYTRRRSHNTIAGPSSTTHVAMDEGISLWETTCRAARPKLFEENMLFRLQRGRGLTEPEHQSLFERCGFCRQYFLASLLRRHLIRCGARV